MTQRERFESRQDRLCHCVERLPPHHAALIRGYYWDGLGIEQLASDGQSSVDAIYKRLQRIRVILLECVRLLEAEPGTG